MIGKVLKAVARAAVAQPWDYMGEGAPGGWEFRLSPEDGGPLALYNPDRGVWLIFQYVDVVAEVECREMDRHTGDWTQFLPVTDPDGLDELNDRSN